MRRYVIASHAHFAQAIKESVELLAGAREDVVSLSMFVDGRDDIAAEAARIVEETPEEDELVICTDLFGGSVNNEFTKVLQRRPNTYLVANMNLPLLIQLLFSDPAESIASTIREIVAADDTRVKFINDLISDGDEEEDF